MFTLVITLIVIVSFLLVLIVLAQNPKGGGLSSQFGGSGASNLIGVKKTTDLLERLTWGFAIALFILTLTTNFIIPNPKGTGITSPNIEKAEQQQQQQIPSLGLDSTQTSQPEEDNALQDLQQTDQADSTK